MVNRDEKGVGLYLRLCSFVKHELACYTVNNDSSDGCCVCFTAREYTAGDNDICLDGAVVRIFEVFSADHENRTMRCLFHHNCGYAYAVIMAYKN